MTKQEIDLLLNQLKSVKRVGDNFFEVFYLDEPQPEFCKQGEDLVLSEKDKKGSKRPVQKDVRAKKDQLSLLDWIE